MHAWARRGRIGPTAIQLGTTADQLAARELGTETPLPSLELVLEKPTAISCDSGDCFYSNTISWRDPTTPLEMEPHPRVVFERLFGDGGTAADRRAQVRQTGSILDSVTEEALSLERTLGPADRNKLSEYLDSVRDLELRIGRAEARDDQAEIDLPDRPIDIPDDFEEYAHADVRSAGPRLAGRRHPRRDADDGPRDEPPHLPADRGARPAPHRVPPPERPRLHGPKAKIDLYHVSLLSRFLQKLRETPDGDGNLLDHSMTVYGGGIGNGNLHEHTNLPCLVAGGGGGRLKGGRHLAYPEDTPMTNLLLAVLDKAGVPAEKLGDSTGRLNTRPLSGV